MLEEDAERVDWGNDDDEPQAPADSFQSYSPRQTMGGYAGEDAEDAVSLGGDDEDEREFFAHHVTEQVSVGVGNVLLTKSTTVTHSHSAKRDPQRQSATSSQHARTPSQSKSSESPGGGLRRTQSANSLPPPMHALPPKPVLVPPHYRPPSPAGPGILASAMIHRQKKSGGSGKSSTGPDGGDPLPPDWEVRYPRNGGKDVYYFNVKTEESTWIRPRLPASGRSSPSKERENGGTHSSGRRSPDAPDAAWSDKSGRGQGPRPRGRDAPSRNGSPPAPNGDLTYQDRHYRPGEASVPAGTGVAGDRRGERAGARSTHLAEASLGRTRSPSPQTAPDSRRRTRSASPPWERGPRRDLSPAAPASRGGFRDPPRDYSQERLPDANWGRSQRSNVLDDSQPASRSPPARRQRRKDDIEPPLPRRRDDVEPSMRRKDDIDPPVRRKDDIEPWIRRKDDIEPPLRRKDDIEPLLRPLPRKQPSTRHANDEWPASRPRSPPPHLREPSPPRRPATPSFPPSAGGYMGPASSNAREPPFYQRTNSPPPRYPPRNLPLNTSTDSVSLRRARDGDVPDPGYDHSKRRRLNDDPGPPRRPPSDLPPPVASLPAKPVAASFPPDGSPLDGPHRKRAPLPPQDQQWRSNRRQGPSVPPPGPLDSGSVLPPPGPGGRFTRPPPPPDDIGRRAYGPPNDTFADRKEDRFRGAPDDVPSGSRRAARSPPRDVDMDRSSRAPPTGPNERRSRFDAPPPSVDKMDIDASPWPRMPQAPPRSTMGGMHADRMLAEPPRGPRAMAPRDGPGGAYSSMPPGGPTPSPTSPYSARSTAAPLPDSPLPVPGGGRGRPMDRRWETNDTGRRPIFSGPEGSGALRDLPDRPPARLAGSDRRDDRPPAPISGTNSIPVGGRSSGYGSDTSVSNAVRSPVDRYRPADNLGGLPRRPPPVEVDSYDRRGPPFPPPDLPPPGPTRVDRAGRRPSVGQDGLARARGGDPISDRPPSTLPPRPRDVPPRDNAPPRQSRVAPASGSGAAPITEPRIWQTRDEAQSARTQDVRPGDSRAPRDDIRPLHDWTSNNEPAAPRRWPVNDSYPPGPGAPEIPGPRTSPEVRLRNRPITPPPAGDGRRYETPLVEHPVAGKVHPERARLLAVDRSVPPEDSGRSGPAGTRRPGRSPERGFRDRVHPDDVDRSLPLRPVDDARMPPPRDRSPPPSQNGYRPNIKRGSSLLERLNLNDVAPGPDGGASLRDRVELAPQGSGDGAASAQVEPMEVDAEGNGNADDAQRAGGTGRGSARRRTGKSRRPRRNGGS